MGLSSSFLQRGINKQLLEIVKKEKKNRRVLSISVLFWPRSLRQLVIYYYLLDHSDSKISKCYRELQNNKLWRQVVALVTKYGVKSDDYLRRSVDDAWTLVWLGWTWLMDRVEDKRGLLNGCWRKKGFPYFVHNTFSRDMFVVMFARWYQIKTAFKWGSN